MISADMHGVGILLAIPTALLNRHDKYPTRAPQNPIVKLPAAEPLLDLEYDEPHEMIGSATITAK